MKTYAIAALALLPGLLCHAAPSEAKQLPGSTPQEFAARIGQLLPGRCHMDGCTWFSLETANLEGTSAKGSLCRLTSKWWSSYHPQHERHPERQYEHAETARRKFESAGVSYVFCSKTMPAVIDTADDSGKWSATMLALQDENAIYGATETTLAFYYAACHDAVVKDVYAATKLASKLGYRVPPPARNADGLINKMMNVPADALKW